MVSTVHLNNYVLTAVSQGIGDQVSEDLTDSPRVTPSHELSSHNSDAIRGGGLVPGFEHLGNLGSNIDRDPHHNQGVGIRRPPPRGPQ